MADEQCTADGCFTLPTWSQFTNSFIGYPIFVQFAVTGVLFVMHPIYKSLLTHSRSFQRFVDTYIGSEKVLHVKRPLLKVSCCIAQVICSCGFVGIFVRRTYTRNHNTLLVGEQVMTAVFTFIYILNRATEEFHTLGAWKLGAIIDVINCAPILSPGIHAINMPQSSQWLSLGFLRSYRALQGYERLMRMVDLEAFGLKGLYVTIFYSLLKVLCMIVIFSATIMIVEILGDFDVEWMLPENFIQPRTDFGPISFLQMSYWIVTTVSTVGYGDYSPKTSLSRALIIVFIFVGLGMFSNEVTTIMEARSDAENYRNARFVPDEDAYKYHIVLVGGGVGVFNNTMETLLADMLADPSTEAAHVPDIVLLSQTDFDPLLVRYVKKDVPPKLVRKVHLLVGDVVLEADQKRASIDSADMVLVVPDMFTSDPTKEDQCNILRCLKVREYFESVHKVKRRKNPAHQATFQLRLMVLLPESRNLAVTQGIKRDHCFSAHELKANLFAQSVNVKGLIPFVAGLLQVTSEIEVRTVRQYFQQESGEYSRWFTDEYLSGLRWNIHGFALAPQYSGMSFAAFSKEAYTKSGGKVMVIGIYDGASDGGRILLNYTNKLTTQEAMIAIANSSRDLQPYTDDADWRVAALSHVASSDLIRTQEQFRQHHLEKLLTMGTFDATVPQISTAKISYRIGTTRTCNLEALDEAAPSTGAVVPTVVESRKEPQESIIAEMPPEDSQQHDQLMGTESFSTHVHSRLHKHKGSIFVVIVGTNVWQEVVALLRNLRSEHLPTWSSVTVLSNQEPPESILRAFGSQHMSFLNGDLYRPANLLGAGILEAHSVLVLRGAGGTTMEAAEIAGTRGTAASDYDSVIIAGVLDQIFLGSPCPPLRVQEFSCTDSVALASGSRWQSLGTTPAFQTRSCAFCSVMASTSNRFEKHKTLKRYVDQAMALWMVFWKPCLVAIAVVRDMFKGDDSARDIDNAILRQLLFRPSFASGQAFTSDFYGGMLGRAFHFPKTVALVEELLHPHPPPGATFPWQVPLPAKWANSKFGDLVEAWLSGEDKDIVGAGPVIVVGLYRQIDLDAGRPMIEIDLEGKYWATLPPRDTVMRSTDLVTVLCTAAFLRQAEEAGWVPKRKTEIFQTHHPHTSTLRRSKTEELTANTDNGTALRWGSPITAASVGGKSDLHPVSEAAAHIPEPIPESKIGMR